MASILSIGQSGLNAAQVGINTTGHNIANANTTGYNRQVVIQGTGIAQGTGFGFVGSGTQVVGVQRVYNDYLTANILSAQSSQGASNVYYSQIQQIDNMFADSTSGLSASIQNFFTGVQNLASDASSIPARQSMLSSAQSLATQFQSVNSQLNEITGGMNSQITGSINNINTYATQIAKLNDSIEKAQAGSQTDIANDLLDQRDQAIANLSKEVKVSVIKQGNSYSISIGNGQPLVVGSQAYQLTTTTSPSDPSRMEVGYVNNGNTVMLPENSITGGALGGLFDFRANTLDSAVNSVGQLAISIGMTFNAQHELGQDLNGDLGGAFFNVGSPVVIPNANNSANSTGQVSATITDANALTTSDYQVKYDVGNVTVTRLSDGTTKSATLASLANSPLVFDGMQFNMTGTPVAGDKYLVKPTAAGAYDFSVAVTDPAKIAAAAPVLTSALSANTGSGKISAGIVNSATIVPTAVSLTYTAGSPGTLSGFPSGLPITVTTPPVAPATTPTTATYAAGSTVPYTGTETISFGGVEVSGLSPLPSSGTSTFSVGIPKSTLTYDGTNLSGFPANLDVTVSVPGTPPAAPTVTTYSAGTPVPYTSGATISVGGVSFSISGTPVAGDQFTIGPNSNGVGDNRNMLLLGKLQQSKTMDNGTNTYGTAFSQLVNAVGNKASELEATSSADTTMLNNAVTAQQSVSGVNLDEEATNLLRYQQAYQAAGKLMQTASQLFDVLLQL